MLIFWAQIKKFHLWSFFVKLFGLKMANLANSG